MQLNLKKINLRKKARIANSLFGKKQSSINYQIFKKKNAHYYKLTMTLNKNLFDLNILRADSIII